MEPQWYFTSSELRDYMSIAVRRQWDTGEVGAKIEAFAIAGCDVGSELINGTAVADIILRTVSDLLGNSKKKADYIKGQIRDRINTMLGKSYFYTRTFGLTFFVVEITGQPNIVMQYVNYERDIVLRHGIELRGWTHPVWANPSELSTSLPPLQGLLDAIKTGNCKFVRLTREERTLREVAYNEKVALGEIHVGRKKRKDAGTKRGAGSSGKRVRGYVQEEEEDDDEEEEEGSGDD